jgi:uracil-DNA glycosylase
VATSSTKAEFITAVSTVKIIKYLCYVLQELELMEPELMLYIGSQAAMCMINDKKPTPCLHHFDIQHFAVQEWHDEGILKAVHIPGVINPSNAATKALASQLHQCQVQWLMGHHGCPNY